MHPGKATMLLVNFLQVHPEKSSKWNLWKISQQSGKVIYRLNVIVTAVTFTWQNFGLFLDYEDDAQ